METDEPVGQLLPDRTPKGLDFNVNLKAPPELKQLIDRIGPVQAGVVKAAYFEGVQSAAIVLVPVILCLLFELIRTKRQ